MNADLQIAHSLMRSMISRMGGEAFRVNYLGYMGAEPSTATVSRKMNGNAEWTLADVQVVQIAAGAPVIFDELMGRYLISPARKTRKALSVLVQAAVASKESGEALSAAMVAEDCRSLEALADARREAAEGRDAFAALVESIDARIAEIEAGA
jgi:hypothetical protein